MWWKLLFKTMQKALRFIELMPEMKWMKRYYVRYNFIKSNFKLLIENRRSQLLRILDTESYVGRAIRISKSN